ncbi:hypothetical protein JQ543_05470 [Bradyrhizobium diazoefficiens]|nr:hypothetical protein [Bradyrhizobium diazoefficiens]
MESAALAAFEHRREHDATSLVSCLPCYPDRRMKGRLYRRQYKQCYRTASEVLDYLLCRGLTVTDALGWHLLRGTEPEPPKPTPTPKVAKPPPPRGGKPRLVYTRRKT